MMIIMTLLGSHCVMTAFGVSITTLQLLLRVVVCLIITTIDYAHPLVVTTK